MSEEVALRDVTRSAAVAFQDEQRRLIRHTIAPTLTEAEFDLFLDIAARHQLNPLTGEIWAAKMPGRNGEPGKLTTIVGRDGFLAIANRNADFEGMDFDIVRENDTFRKLADGTYEHTFDMSGGKDRGKPIGAYAVVYRRGRRPTPFFAPWAEYNSGRNAWKSNPTAMIIKCAQANALRLAYNLSGLYSDAEMDHVVSDPDRNHELEPDFGTDELGDRLRGLVDRANDLKPGSYRPAKVRMLLANATDLERAAFAESLERFIAEHESVVDADAVEVTPEAPPLPLDQQTEEELMQALKDAEEAAESATVEEEREEWTRLADNIRQRLDELPIDEAA